MSGKELEDPKAAKERAKAEKKLAKARVKAEKTPVITIGESIIASAPVLVSTPWSSPWASSGMPVRLPALS